MRAAGILYVIAQLGAGGTERQILSLLRGLDRSLYDPEVVTFTPGGALESAFREACPLQVMPKSPATEARVFLALAERVRRTRPAIVHTSLFPANWRGAIAAALSARPLFIASVRNMGAWMGPGRRFVEGMVLRSADAVIVNSEAVARDLVVNAGARRSTIRVVPNGVDLDLYRPPRDGEGDLCEELWSDRGSECVGAVMSLTSKKNPFLLVEAARRVVAARPGTRFFIAGEGPLRFEIERRISGAGLAGRVQLVGLRSDVPELLRSIDLLALPSDREGLPNVVLEAMATGLPVVATAVGGTPEIVREGLTGRLVPPGDPETFARAIVEILSEPGASSRMGQEGRRVAISEYGLGTMVERTQALYSDLLGTRFSARPARAAGA